MLDISRFSGPFYGKENYDAHCTNKKKISGQFFASKLHSNVITSTLVGSQSGLRSRRRMEMARNNHKTKADQSGL